MNFEVLNIPACFYHDTRLDGILICINVAAMQMGAMNYFGKGGTAVPTKFTQHLLTCLTTE
jgi:hypothetical protein